MALTSKKGSGLFKIVVDIYSTPSSHKTGFYDVLRVYDNLAGKLHLTQVCSASPNGYKSGEVTGSEWQRHYCFIAPQICSAEIEDDNPRYGDCISLNGGEEVATRIPNPNNNGKYSMCDTKIHVGGVGANKGWRGSVGSITVPFQDFENFIYICKKLGQHGLVYINDAKEVDAWQ